MTEKAKNSLLGSPLDVGSIPTVSTTRGRSVSTMCGRSDESGDLRLNINANNIVPFQKATVSLNR